MNVLGDYTGTKTKLYGSNVKIRSSAFSRLVPGASWSDAVVNAVYLHQSV